MTAIECKLIREGGSFVALGTTEYHFSPQADGAHVAQVADDEHVDIFLSIRDGYRLYRGKVEAASKPAEISDSPNETEAAIEPAPEVVTMLGSTEDIPPPSEPSPAEERAYLAAEYEELYGEPPHARTGVKRLREMIAAKQTV